MRTLSNSILTVLAFGLCFGQTHAASAETLPPLKEGEGNLDKETVASYPAIKGMKILCVKRAMPKPGKRGPNFPTTMTSMGFPSNHECQSVVNKMNCDNELGILDLATGKYTTLYRPEDKNFVGHMNLHWNARKLIFTQSDTANYKIYEINVDGTGLRQVSQTPDDVDCFEPCYLPDGRIIFNSNAPYQSVPCWHGTSQKFVANLYVMDADGSNMRRLTFDQDHDFHPFVCHNGQVVYSRWDYTGINRIFLRPVMSMNPDGTSQKALYGSNSWFPNGLYYPKELPGRVGQFLCVLAGYHASFRSGVLAVIDLNKGSQEDKGFVCQINGIDKKVEPIYKDGLTVGFWPQFFTPTPVTDNVFLTSALKKSNDSHIGIYVADMEDNVRPLFSKKDFAFLEPIPLIERKQPPAIPSRVDLDDPEATVYIQDIYYGPGLKDVPRGTIKDVRVVAYDFGHIGLAGNDIIGLSGPWDAMSIVGTAPVEKDGSAIFKVPANTPIAFQALDAEGKAVQLMRSWVTAMPGENMSCVGCHESPNDVPPARRTAASGQKPRPLNPWYGPARGFDFAREVQPVLNRYCVGCHNQEHKLDLRSQEHFPNYTGRTPGRLNYERMHEFHKEKFDNKVLYTPAYEALVPYIRRVGIGDDVSLLEPGEYHADTSLLVQILQAGHKGIKMDTESWSRLITWIDLNGPCHGTWTDVYNLAVPDKHTERRWELAKLYGAPAANPNDVPKTPKYDETPVKFKALPEKRDAKIQPLPEIPTLEHESIDLGDGQSISLVRFGQPYWMGTCEISNAQFQRFDPDHFSRYYIRRHTKRADGRGMMLDQPDQPALRVSWDRAMAFCKWLSEKTGLEVTLPTEEQWETACRAGSGRSFHYPTEDFSQWGNIADKTFATVGYRGRSLLKKFVVEGDLCLLVAEGVDFADQRFDDGAVVTKPVGSYKPNAFGLHDTHGNVAEWTLTDVGNGAKTVKGGSFLDPPGRCSADARLGYPPWQNVHNTGFRIVVNGELTEKQVTRQKPTVRTGDNRSEAGSSLRNPAPDLAGRALKASDVRGGLVVVLGSDPELLAGFGADRGFVVQGLDADADRVVRSREALRGSGLYGPNTVKHWTAAHLPYASGVVNLLVAPEGAKNVADGEIDRVLAPRGVALVSGGRRVKAVPPEIDEWTHFLHGPDNNAVAKDSVVGPPRYLKWTGGPKYGRNHEIDSSVASAVSARGRLFYVLDEGLTGFMGKYLPQTWALVARDAFSGVILWKRPVPDMGWTQWKPVMADADWSQLKGHRRHMPITLPRRVVSDGDRVFTSMGYHAPLSILDAATGKTIRTVESTMGTDEILFHDNTLYLVVRAHSRGSLDKKEDTLAIIDRVDRLITNHPGTVMAVDPDRGEILWQVPSEKLLPLSLTLGGDRVFFHTGEELVCLDRKKGNKLWNVPNTNAKSMRWNITQTLVAHGDVLLVGTSTKIEAFSAETGELLWEGKGGRKNHLPINLYVIDGLVWSPDEDKPGSVAEGRDLLTGEVRRTIKLPQYMYTGGHHFRCYRGKATERYILENRRGIEMLDLTGKNFVKNDWVRGMCRYGILPCNGMIYSTPSPCACFPVAQLTGFNALSAGSHLQERRSERLIKGPAFDTPLDKSADAKDWPMLRGDMLRTGASRTTVDAHLKPLWKAELKGKLTQPVVAGGMVFVASIDAHSVHALNAETGETLWSHTVDGRVDSPPTHYRGRLFFGSANGWMYSLRASDGTLAWRSRVAPGDEQIVSYNQLESVWPLRGSALVVDDVVYAAAGRNSRLNDGLFLVGLDAATGTKRSDARLKHALQDPDKDQGLTFEMDGSKLDVLSSDGTHFYMQRAVFDLSLNPVARSSKRVRRIYASAGFLDDHAWNRNAWSWMVNSGSLHLRWKNLAGMAHTGQLLVQGGMRIYGVKYFLDYSHVSSVFYPGKRGYKLFAHHVDAIGGRAPGPTARKRSKKEQSSPPSNVIAWECMLPVRVRAMTKAGDILFVAGAPDVVAAKDPLAAFEGRKGAVLKAFTSADGKELSEVQLDSPPVFDGLIAADGKLFMCAIDGSVICLGK